MLFVKHVDPRALANTATFQLGTVGAVVTERFSALIAEFGLKPKHAGILQAILLNDGVSQQDLAKLMHVAPSLVVGLVDHLESVGAVSRERDPVDRRRQHLVVTEKGLALFMRCVKAAEAIEEEILADVREGGLDFRAGLNSVAVRLGLPAAEPHRGTPAARGESAA